MKSAKFLATLLIVLWVTTLATGQITIPNTFSPNTTISSSAVNANFSELGTKSLNRTGGTLTGNLSVSGGVTVDGADISAYLSGGKLLASSTAADSIDVGGGITAGTGNVAIVDTTGKIPALSTTYFASVSGANLTTLNATNLSSGTVPDARFPAVLPAVDGSALTGITTVPSGMVAPFVTGACPSGWAEMTAGRGRVIVGLVSGGTNTLTVGTAYTNGENRSHTHSVPRGGWNPVADGVGSFLKVDIEQPDSDGNFNNINMAGSDNTSGTAADLVPYLQLIMCQKS